VFSVVDGNLISAWHPPRRLRHFARRGWARIRSPFERVEDNFLLWLMPNLWQQFPSNSADKQRKNSAAFAEERILAQPRRANQFDFCSIPLHVTARRREKSRAPEI
jgi:hypothetical protein